MIRFGFLKKSPSSSLFKGTVPIRFSLKPGCGFKRRVVVGDSVIIDDLYCLILIPGEYIRIGTYSWISLWSILEEDIECELEKSFGLFSDSMYSSSFSNYSLSCKVLWPCHLSIFKVTLSNYILRGWFIRWKNNEYQSFIICHFKVFIVTVIHISTIWDLLIDLHHWGKKENLKLLWYNLLEHILITVFSLNSRANLFILSGKVKGISVLFIRVIQGCFSASIAEYRCAMLNFVNFMKKSWAKVERWLGKLS